MLRYQAIFEQNRGNAENPSHCVKKDSETEKVKKDTRLRDILRTNAILPRLSFLRDHSLPLRILIDRIS